MLLFLLGVVCGVVLSAAAAELLFWLLVRRVERDW